MAGDWQPPDPSDPNYASKVAAHIIDQQQSGGGGGGGIAPVLPSIDVSIPGGGVDLTQPYAQGQQGAGNMNPGGPPGTGDGSSGSGAGSAGDGTAAQSTSTGGGVVGDLLGAIIAPLIAPLTAIGKFFSALSWITLPSSWVRIFSGVAGCALLFFGIASLIREVKAK